MNAIIQKLRRVLMAAMMCIIAVAAGAKERVVTEMPEPETLVAGQTYYVYNVGSESWLSYNSSYAIASSTPQKVQFTTPNSGYSYSLNFVDIDRRIRIDSSLGLTTTSGTDYHTQVYVDAVEGGYKLRPWSNNSNNQYLGVDGSGNLQRLLSSGHIVWRLYSPSNRQLNRYFFYRELVTSDNYDFDASKYEDMYAVDTCTVADMQAAIAELKARNALAKVIADNSQFRGALNEWKEVLYNTESTTTQLNNARTELNRSLTYSNTLTKASGNEYPLLFTRTSPNWKVRMDYTNTATIEYNYSYYSSGNNWDYVTSYNNYNSYYVGNYKYSDSYNLTTTTWDLPVTVDVDADAVFYFNYYCSGDYYTPRLIIFLDGEPFRNVYYTEGNTSRKNVIELTPGVHTVTLRCKRDYGISSSTYFQLYDFGCRKTGDEISVNLLEAGSLGTEVLYHVDNIRQVKKLKVKGPMNDEDWQRIYMMTDLSSLDLRDAEITTIKASQVSVDAHSSLSNLTRFVLPRTVKTIESKAFYNTFIGEQDFPEGLETIGANAYQYSDVPKALLPQSLRSIGTYAFSDCTRLNEVSLPDDVSVGTYAFNFCTGLKTANLPKNMVEVPAYMFCNCGALDTLVIGDKIESVGDYSFSQCYSMKMANLPNTLRTIGQYSFYNCDSLKEFVLPEGLTTIGKEAFRGANYFHSPIPSTLKTIGTCAFQDCYGLDTIRIVGSANVAEQAFLNCTHVKTLIIEESATIGKNAFQYCSGLDSVVVNENVSLGTTPFNGCTNLRYIEFPTTYYTCSAQLLSNITGGNLEKVVFKSPTMIQGSAYTSFFSGVNTTNLSIYVPSFQRNNYRLDSYWYNWPIESIDPAEISDWTVNSAMTFGANERFGDQANVSFTTAGSLKVNGDTPLAFHDLKTHRNGSTFSMLLSNCDHVSISGTFNQRYYTAKNTWNFITLPFDFKVSDVTSDAGAQMVMRYYDGAHRAASGTSGNWKNLPADSIVPAGSGLILMTSRDGWVNFYAQDNASKQNVLANHQLAKALQANPSETSANKGWNMVGNMWLTYYNDHKLNFSAPITVWTGSTYKAYSLIDDDYAIRPMEAFFVQCPENIDNISFPTEGRQLTSVIESQNAARGEKPSSRYIVDLALSEDSLADETRIVINDEASLDYETTCDASKFMTLDTQTAQMWSVRNGVNYAINERPLDDAVVRLGFSAAHDGEYTLSLKRNQAGSVLLTDRLTGTETDLSAGDYVFSAEAGTTNVRFELRFNNCQLTGISHTTLPVAETEIYTLEGRRLNQASANGKLPKGIYVVRRGGQTEKIMVK